MKERAATADMRSMTATKRIPRCITEHHEIAREVRRVAESGGAQMTELIVRAAALRHFLG